MFNNNIPITENLVKDEISLIKENEHYLKELEEKISEIKKLKKDFFSIDKKPSIINDLTLLEEKKQEKLSKIEMLIEEAKIIASELASKDFSQQKEVATRLETLTEQINLSEVFLEKIHLKNEIVFLEKHIEKSIQEEKDKINKRQNDLMSEKQKLISLSSNLDREIQNLNNTLNETNKKIKTSSKSIITKENKIAEIVSNLTDYDKKINSLKDENKTFRDKQHSYINPYQEELNRHIYIEPYQKKVDRLITENTPLKTETDSEKIHLIKIYLESIPEIREFEDLIEKNQKKIDFFEKQKVTLKNERVTLEQTKETLEEEKATLKKEKDALNIIHNNLTQEKAGKEKEKGQNEIKILTLEREIVKFEEEKRISQRKLNDSLLDPRTKLQETIVQLKELEDQNNLTTDQNISDEKKELNSAEIPDQKTNEQSKDFITLVFGAVLLGALVTATKKAKEAVIAGTLLILMAGLAGLAGLKAIAERLGPSKPVHKLASAVSTFFYKDKKKVEDCSLIVSPRHDLNALADAEQIEETRESFPYTGNQEVSALMFATKTIEENPMNNPEQANSKYNYNRMMGG